MKSFSASCLRPVAATTTRGRQRRLERAGPPSCRRVQARAIRREPVPARASGADPQRACAPEPGRVADAEDSRTARLCIRATGPAPAGGASTGVAGELASERATGLSTGARRPMPDHEQAADEPRPDAERPDGRSAYPGRRRPDGRHRARDRGLRGAHRRAHAAQRAGGDRAAEDGDPLLAVPDPRRSGSGQERRVSSTEVTGVYQATGGPQPFVTTRPPLADDTTLVPLLERKGVQFTGSQPSPLSGFVSNFVLSWLLPFVLLAGLWGLAFRRFGPGAGAMNFGPLAPQDLRPQDLRAHVRRRAPASTRRSRSCARSWTSYRRPAAVRAPRRADPEGSPARRTAGDRQDAAGAGGGGRGRRSLLLPVGL